MFDKLNAALVKALRIFSVFLFSSMIVVVACQVIFRYFINMPLAWTDEVARLLLVWISFIGITTLFFTKEGHPAVTFLLESLPAGTARLFRLGMDALYILTFSVVVYQGLLYSSKVHRFVSDVLHYPNSLKYIVLPLSFFLMTYKSIYNLCDGLSKDSPKAHPDHTD